MRKAFLLAWSHIRASRGQAVSLLIVLTLATIVMQTGLILAMDYSSNFDRRADLVNAEDAVFSFQTRDDAAISEFKDILLSDSRTAELEVQETLCHVISYDFGDADMNSHVVILPVDAPRNLGRFRFVQRAETETADTVYLPYLFCTGGGYAMGDSFRVAVKGKEFVYTVGGFYESALIGSFNGGVSSFLLSSEGYEKLEAATDIRGVLLSVKLNDRRDNAAFFSEVGNELNAMAGSVVHNSTYYDMAKSSRTLTANICSLIFLGLAILVTLIVLVITAFRISHNIEQDMPSYGALQAMGYTTGQIVRSILLQFLLIAAAGAAAGCALTYAVLPVSNRLLELQTGLIWQVGFQPAPLLIVFAVLLATIAATALIATGRLRRLPPITALRQGVATHSFRRDPLPLATTRGPVAVVLSMKAALRNLRQNLSVLFITCILSLLCVFMSVMLHSFCIDTSAMTTLLGGEVTDAAVYTSAEDADEMLAALNAREGVERAYRYQTVPALAEGEQLSLYVVEDCADLNDPEILYEGRLPKFENEIALGGRFARAHGVPVGGTITVRQGEREAEYLVTGYIQCTNYLGKDGMMLHSGLRRILSEPLTGGFYVNLAPGTDIDAFLDALAKEYGSRIVTSINVQAVLEGGLGTYTAIVGGLVAALSVLALAIVALVLYLMVKTMLLRKRRDHGIQKALGFTTAQLVLQTALSFLPAILLGAAVGFAAGVAAVNPLLTVLFSGIGVMKAMFPINALLTAGFGIALLLFSMGVTALLSLRVRKVSPRALMTGE